MYAIRSYYADELEHLGDEFDLPDAPRPQFDVVVLVLFSHLPPDLGVEVPHGGKGTEIQVFPEHEGQAQSYNFV